MTLVRFTSAFCLASLLLLIVQSGCCPPAPSGSSGSSDSMPKLSSAELAGTWRQQMPTPGDYPDLVLNADGTASMTIHLGDTSRNNMIAAGASAAVVSKDVIETGRWGLANGDLELSFSSGEPAHPSLLKGLQLQGGTLEAKSNCVWISGEYACSEVVQHYSHLADR